MISLSTGASYLGPQPSLTKISECITEFTSWFSNNHIMVNSTKSLVMFIGSPILLSKCNLPAEDTFEATKFSVSFKLKILSVTLDASLYFTHFASQLIQASNFHLHAIKQIRKFLPFNTAIALNMSLVLFRLDYCNSLFCGLPNCLISKLQSLQNRAAKIVLQADYYSSYCAYLDRLHWLPVAQKAQFKLLWLTVNILYFNQPAFLYELILSQRLMNLSGLRTLHYGYIGLSLLTLFYIALFRISPLIYRILFHSICVSHLLLNSKYCSIYKTTLLIIYNDHSSNQLSSTKKFQEAI